ncbi:MAG: hypothetical protein PHV48_00490 [Candidatus Omnitrophica bacterium]|nr:hypothetical protein [Candidatus Omnitrophota bacterium]
MPLRTGIVIIAVMLMMAGTAMHSYSEDSSGENRTMTMQGNVTAIDWVGSVLTVNDMVFFVPSNVKVVKGTDRINFSAINTGDSVKVTYSREKDGSLRVSDIIVAYSGSFPV